MQRRALLILATLAWPAWGPAAPLGMDAALFVEPDAPPQALWRVQPAQGPLDRHAGRPGAWVGLLYLPMLPGQPAELVLRTALRRHTLRLLALDQAPADAPSVAAVLPLEPNSRQDGERPSFHVSRFMLPATSLADGLYVLVEQWRADGAPPAPLWLQLRTRLPAPDERRGPPVPAGRGVDAPPSPLNRALREQVAFEVPLPAPRAGER